MAQFGMQPNGMIKLADGSTWDPSQPLPPENAGGFNATPMGSPLNGLGTMAPTAVVTPYVTGADPAPPAAPQGIPPVASGMFGNTTVRPPVPPADPSPVMGLDVGTPTIPGKKPGFNEPGGWGGKLSDLGDILLAASGNPAGPALLQAQSERKQNAFALQKQGVQQQLEFQRQLALAQYKNANQDSRTALQKDAEAAGLRPGTPEYQSFISNATMAPVITTVNGQPMAYSRAQLNAGIGGGGASFPRVSDESSYNALKSGDHFLDPQGNVRVKP